MAYQIIRSTDLGIANRSDMENAGAYSRVYKMDESALYFVTTSLNKLHYIKHLGLSMSPIYAWYQKNAWNEVPTGDKKEYMMVVPKLLTYREASEESTSKHYEIRRYAENIYTDQCGWSKLAVGKLKIKTQAMEEAYNAFPQLEDLSKFMLTTYKKQTQIAVDCHGGNVLYCPITGTPILYDIINFERMEGKDYIN